MWLTRRHLLAFGVLGPAGFARSGSPRALAATISSLPSGAIALGGFDAVSYFLEGPEAGRPDQEVLWIGKTWRFARKANREAFQRDPATYAPRLGGFDPLGVLAGRLVDTDPLVFARCVGPAGVERLYLLRNAEHRIRVLADPSLVEQAEARWPTLRDQIERDFQD